MGYRSDSIEVSGDMGALRSLETLKMLSALIKEINALLINKEDFADLAGIFWYWLYARYPILVREKNPH